ncbi:MAG TPA: YidC/Oxa1 family membrane protein insertase [Dehalococcoidales bacterium]|nr:YidC/Oxa1 family membrane protein insertase [Dehalococcoidales bacterium]
MDIGGIWNLIAMQPVINTLVVLTHFLFNNFGLAIIALTLIVNGAMFPLTLKQIRASKAMQEMQPKIAELKKKYGKDKEKMAREQMKLYKESGVSPAGCLLPMLIQMPIWIALFQSIMRVLAVIPENLAGLSQYLYSWPVVYSALPLNNHFLWLNLATGDIFLALLVGGTMWVQQKMVMAPTIDPSQKTQSSLMLWIMPIMFAWLTLSFPSGLAIFWVTSNLFRIGLQYWIGGWGGLVKSSPKRDNDRDKKYKQRIASVEKASTGDADIVPSSAQEEDLSYEESGDKRPDSGGGSPKSPRDTKPKSRRGGSHRRKRG